MFRVGVVVTSMALKSGYDAYFTRVLGDCSKGERDTIIALWQMWKY